jgi:hypothetical protein
VAGPDAAETAKRQHAADESEPGPR